MVRRYSLRVGADNTTNPLTAVAFNASTVNVTATFAGFMTIMLRTLRPPSVAIAIVS